MKRRSALTVAQELRQLSKFLRYDGGKRKNATARKAFMRWRELQDTPIPRRCDNEACRFFKEPLTWNDKPLPLIFSHSNGVNSHNRVDNLKLLCPNCNEQELLTKGGANKGRVEKSSGGFAIKERGLPKRYELPADTIFIDVPVPDAHASGAAVDRSSPRPRVPAMKQRRR